MEREELLEFLAAREYVFSFFARLFSDIPTVEMMDALDVPLLRQAFEMWAEGPLEQGGAANAMVEMLEHGVDLELLRENYTKVFWGPGNLPGYPWESMYRAKDRALFSEFTLSVRSAYKAQGFATASGTSVADDHVALEMRFLANLASRMLKEAEDDADAFARDVQASADFEAEHCAMWLSKYAADLEENAAGSLYTLAVRAAAGYIEEDRGFLNSLR